MVKVISLSNEAYGKLKSLKGDKSFSEVVMELSELSPRKDIMSFFGAFAENSEEWGKINEKIYADRKNFKLREFKF